MTVQEELKAINTRLNEIAQQAYEAHKQAFEVWPHGDIVKTWMEKNVLCIEYKSGTYFHYTSSDVNYKDPNSWIYW